MTIKLMNQKPNHPSMFSCACCFLRPRPRILADLLFSLLSDD